MRTGTLWKALAAAVGALAVLVPAAASAAEPAPAWQLRAFGYATNFAPGSTSDSGTPPGYKLIAKNVGGGDTSGKFTIVDQLPAGVSPSFKLKPFGYFGPEQSATAMTCSSSTKTVTCSGSGAVHPGQNVEVVIPLEVKANASTPILNTATIEGGGAPPASTEVETEVSTTSAAFGFLESAGGAYGSITNADGSTATAAGSHPFQLSVGMGFNDVAPQEIGDTLRVPGGGIRTIEADLPKGVIVNPQAVETCTEVQLESFSCPPGSQVGTVTLQLSLSGGSPGFPILPLYNMVPPPGLPAEFGFEVLEGTYVHIKGALRSNDRFRLAADVNAIPAKIGVMGAETTLWGSPSDPAHDYSRSQCLKYGGACTTERNQRSFLSMPSSCGGPLQTDLRIENWFRETAATSYLTSDLDGALSGIDGCNQVQFEPSIESKATTNVADSPSGLDFDLRVPQNEDFDGRATANLKDARVALPVGMAVNPSAAAGLGGCTRAQIGLATEAEVTCPDDSKVGTVAITTPLLDDPVSGSIYLATPFDNPSGTLLGLYIGVEDPQRGVVIKLSGKVEPDATTGQLTATFAENPELPFEDFQLEFFNGARAPLTSPLTCGTHTTTSTLTPWSTPEGADAHPTDSFQTTVGCVASEAAAPKTVNFSAGTVSPLSGAHSPFVLRMARPDGTQRITGVETTLPQGLLGKLAGVSYCPEGGIAQAIAREHPEQGKLEQSSPSCPASSEVGSVQVTAGSGITPIPVSGRAYLAGPYKGAPLSLAIVVPAVAGPFDLGTVVNRVALNVGTFDARIHAVSDPLPTIREGIPLDVRSIELKLDRPDFTLNPTSCEVAAIEGSVTTQPGQSAPLNNRFQVGECGRLKFKPKLKLSLKGRTTRSGHPALKAVLTMPKGGANIARAQVGLPRSEFIDQGNLDQVCLQADLKAGTCPKRTIYGKAKAWSPLLDKPLEGPVYLGAGFGYTLPALVADLDGQIRVLLKGKVDTTKKGGLRNTFEAVPDAPVSRFVLEMKGGPKYGLLENSVDICKSPQRASVQFTAHNGKVANLRPLIANSCGKAKKGKEKPGRHKGG